MVLTIPQHIFIVEEYLKSNGNVKLLLINFVKKFPNAESVNRRHITLSGKQVSNTWDSVQPSICVRQNSTVTCYREG